MIGLKSSIMKNRREFIKKSSLTILATTLSPQSTWGVKLVLCLPLSSLATIDAVLPNGNSEASTRTHSLLTVFLFAEIVL